MVGDSAFVVDEEVSGLAEVFNNSQRFGFGDFMAEVRHQIAGQFRLAPRTFGGGLAQMRQHACFLIVRAGRRQSHGL